MLVFALAAGCALAAAAWYSWRTQAEVDRLRAQVCAYEQASVQIIGQLGYSLPVLPISRQSELCR